MHSNIIVGFLLVACAASCLGSCIPEPNHSAESYLCTDIRNLAELDVIPEIAQRITILESTLNTIPGNSFVKFGRSLVYLRISESNVNDIQPGAFSGLSVLEELVLDHNHIKSIRTDWVHGLTTLRKLRIWQNDITQIEPAVFNELTNLELLDIAHNKIGDCLTVELVQQLRRLEIIYLTDNPWPLHCRPPVLFHLTNRHVHIISGWGNSHILIEECLAHDPTLISNPANLQKCVHKWQDPLIQHADDSHKNH